MVAPRCFPASQIRSGVAGTLTEIDQAAMKAIRSLDSYQSEMVGTAVGKRVEKTIDLVRAHVGLALRAFCSRAVAAQLAHGS
jgi:hypothetical protein